MKLISVNVSLPVEIEYNNKLISTGIFKKPVNSEITISASGLAGDQQVDLNKHGGEHKAVYAFSADHYDYWRTELEQPELHYGQFGENLTISDLDEATLCIGDQLKIGDCLLEITQPRVPCYKLGIAINLKTMPKLFVQHGATGMYFRVLASGSIKQGDAIERVHQHPQQLAVKTLFNAYFDSNFVNPVKILQRAADITELSEEWRQKVLVRLSPT
ncbi:MAG: MOSC domain-containing protein [Piscirickettsiaceae bacterium]|nr:MOSC domain-containing protein [Piscirickettsiaceae bacterium]